MKVLRPLIAIRQNCLECMGGSTKAVKECDLDCPLHTFRFGHNPNRKGVGGSIKKKMIK